MREWRQLTQATLFDSHLIRRNSEFLLIIIVTDISYLSSFSMFFSGVGHEGMRGMVVLFYSLASACFQFGNGLVSGAKRFHTHYGTIAVIHRLHNPRDFSVQSPLGIQLQLMLE
jgi:hypothetical protein